MSDHRPPPRKGQPPRRGPHPGASARRPIPRPPQGENTIQRVAPRENVEGSERLQKVLAHAGVGSRRSCEELITQGRVTINGQVVRELGTKVDPQQAKVEVDGQRVQGERLVYFAVHKPKGYVSSNNDPAGKPRVIDLLPEIPQRVYTVGRLDEQSTGLLLLTNDGELANRLAHPKFGVEKIYRVVVAGEPGREVLDQLTQGVWLAEGKVRAKRVRVVGSKGQATILEMVLAEGKNREIRRMLARFGHKVMSLTRIAVGPIGLKGISVGECRPLSASELDLLRQVAAGVILPTPRFPDRRDRKDRPGRPPARSSSGSDQGDVRRPSRSSGPFQRDNEGRGGEQRPGRPSGPAMRERPAQDRPGGSGLGEQRPPRPSGPTVRPTGNRSYQRPAEGQDRPPRPGDRRPSTGSPRPGDRRPSNGPPRPSQGGGMYNRPGQDRDQGSANRPRDGAGNQQGAGQDRRPSNGPPRPSQGGGMYNRPGQDRDQGSANRSREGAEYQQRAGQDRVPSHRPPRPAVQNRPPSGPPPLRVNRPPAATGDETPTRKIIGLDMEPGAGRRPPKRAPRASLGVKRPGKRQRPGEE